MDIFWSHTIKQFICLLFLHRYLLELNRKSDEVPDPNKEAVIDQWVEWESVSLQVSHSVHVGEWQRRVLYILIIF